MKCTILKKLFSTCLLAAISINFCYAEDEQIFSDLSINLRHSSSSSSTESFQSEVSRCAVESINAWQVKAVYVKAGIESIAKETLGDELSQINTQLARNSATINRIINRNSCSPERCTPNSLNFLLDRQNELIFDYVRALINGTPEEQANILEALSLNLDRISRSINSRSPHKKNADSIDELLNLYLEATIAESQNFVDALFSVLPPADVDFAPAYESYLLTVEYADLLGQVIGSTFCNGRRNCEKSHHHHRCR